MAGAGEAVAPEMEREEVRARAAAKVATAEAAASGAVGATTQPRRGGRRLSWAVVQLSGRRG